MIDIKFSENFEEELETVFENLEKNQKNVEPQSNFDYKSPYCYDLKSLISNNESSVMNPNPLATENHQSSPPKSK